MWYYLIDNATGALVSDTDVDPGVVPGYTVVSRGDRKGRHEHWDSQSQGWVTITPSLPGSRKSMFQDWVTRQPEFEIFWPQLDAAGRQALNRVLVRGLTKLLRDQDRYDDSDDRDDFGV